jgi:uncharacterized membrane protein
MRRFLYIAVLAAAFMPLLGFAAEPASVATTAPSEQVIIEDKVEVVKARVISIKESRQGVIAGTDAPAQFQTIEAEILEGTQTGKRLTVENDYLMLEEGEVFYLSHTTRGDTGTEVYAVFDPYRLPALAWLCVIFVIVVVVFGGIQGVRGLASLVGSLALIMYVLLPSIAQGYSPVLASVGVASLIIVLGSYVTHGFTKTTSSAVIGMIGTVVVTGLLAHLAVIWTKLSGFESDESVYLNISSAGTIDLKGLLFGGIVIGLLGVLYDAAIGQSVAVEELHRVGPHLSRRYIYTRALRIGREHIGALVNTLAIAYAGASLPLLLLLQTLHDTPWLSMINKEMFAAEIVRTLVGSIGLVLTVPITTLIAVVMLVKKPSDASPDVTAKEAEAVEEHVCAHKGCAHTHHHA